MSSSNLEENRAKILHTEGATGYYHLDYNEQLLRKIKRFFCRHDLYTEHHVMSNDNRLICRKCGKIKPSWKGQKI